MTGIILINFGGPRSGEEIKPFLKDLFNDVLPRPLKPLASLLASLREPYAKKMYDAIGGASPVVGWTIKQAIMLETKLNTIAPPPHLSPSRGEGKGGGDTGYKIYISMKYGRPSISDAIAEVKEAGCEKIIAFPLFPYQSRYTNLSTCQLGQLGQLANSVNLSTWSTHPLYINAMVDIIKTALEKWKNEPPPNIHLLFSVHAIPSSSAKKEPYIRQINESVSKIMGHFIGYNYHLAFQSQYGPIRWTGPNVKTVLKILSRAPSPLLLASSHKGRRDFGKAILLIPIGFACENIETLYEIDELYIPYAKNLGFQNIARTPCFNDNPQFIDLLAELVIFSICSNEP